MIAPVNKQSSEAHDRGDGKSRPRNKKSSTDTRSGVLERKMINVSTFAYCRTLTLQNRAAKNASETTMWDLALLQVKSLRLTKPQAAAATVLKILVTNWKHKRRFGDGKAVIAALFTINIVEEHTANSNMAKIRFFLLCGDSSTNSIAESMSLRGALF